MQFFKYLDFNYDTLPEGCLIYHMKNKNIFWCCGIRLKEGDKCSICGERMEKEMEHHVPEKSKIPENTKNKKVCA